MKRGLFLLFGALLLVAGRAAADDASGQDDKRFVEELRKQGKSDLALEYLQKLGKNASPEFAKELPLELAETRLDAAGEEPDSGKRLALYAESRDELQKWLDANPTHPRAGEVKLNIAQVAVMQGRTQLSQALMNPDFDEVMTPEAAKARAILVDAGVQMQQAAKSLDPKLALQAELNLALNLFDQSQTYPRNATSQEMAKARAAKVEEAQKAFQTLMSKDEQNPICWIAKAWYGRCLHENGDANKAKAEYSKILSADKRIAAEGQRLARYFRLLVIAEKPEGKEDDNYIVDQGKEWIANYPGFLKTPEGYGLLYLMGKEYFILSSNEKTPADKKAQDLAEARRLLRQVEASENDFTDRARRLKITVIATQQGGFKEPVDKLKNFEDCYVRAQFEQMEMAKDNAKAEADEAKEPNEDAKKRLQSDAEEKRKEHQALIAAALERGLKLADESKDSHGEVALELGNAKALLAFQYMNAKKYRETIDIAEPFARKDPRSAQAAAAATYALQCYAEMLSNQEQAGKTADELKGEKAKVLDFAAFMERTWPKEMAGDMARNQLALLYINDKDPDKREENVQQAILAMSRITPGYRNYTTTQYQLALYAFGADKDKLKPIPGDPEDGYRKRALTALETIPPLAAGADPITNKVYFLAKIRLGQEYFTLKKYDEMEQLSTTLLPKLEGVELDADKAKGDELRGQMKDSLGSFRLYARWAKADGEAKAAEKADAAGKAAHYAKILELLDPIVDEILAHQHPELKSNLPLARGILDNELRATIQLNKLDRTTLVLNGYKELASGDAADAGATEVLKQLVLFIPPQLEELKHKKDGAEDLKKAQETFGKILEDTIKPLGDKMTPKLKYFTAQIYSSIGRHKEAADLLDKAPEPAADAQKTDVDIYETARVMEVRERRLNGETEAARKAMNDIMGDPKTGWGRKKIDALLENVELMGAEGKNKEAAEYVNALIQKLVPKIDADNKIKEAFLQGNYLLVENAYRQAQKLKAKVPAKYPEGVKTAATLAVDLAKKQGGFVTDETRGRFRDLMDAEPDLKDAFVDADLTAVEAGCKQAAALKDKSAHDKAVSDAAALIVDLEKMWPDYGSDAAKGRVTALLSNEADLKAAYDQLKAPAQ